jgi:hypothetical protein
MKRWLATTAALAALAGFYGCKQQPGSGASSQQPVGVSTPATVDLAGLANAVPNTGPRTGNNYKVFLLALRQNQQPAVGFRVDMTVKGKGETVTLKTNEAGLVKFESLPFPDAKHPLIGVLHYYNGAEDQSREITYPYIEGDAYRLKDTQYIPNTVTPEPQ